MSALPGVGENMMARAARSVRTRETDFRTLLLVIADGVRYDVLRDEMEKGRVPAMAQLSDRGGLHEITSCFPSVTGSGYVPFLTGRFPGDVGLPGLRWYDRTRRIGLWPSYSRSYAGIDIWHVDRDLDKATPTLMELAQPSISCMSMLGRGAEVNVGRSVRWMLRAGRAHYSASQELWRRVEQRGTREFLGHLRAMRPRVAVLAITGPDKQAHKEGPGSESVREAIRDMDAAIQSASDLASQDGWREQLDIWVVGDHGHSAVSQHEDLHGWLEAHGKRVLAHPQIFRHRVDVALMVGGNAMAHLYLEPHHRIRPWWPDLAPKWEALHEALLARPSVDLLCVALSAERVRVGGRERGHAEISFAGIGTERRWSYLPLDGDPLHLGGAYQALDTNAAWELCSVTPYPDSLVQLSAVSVAPRSGDLIVSASAGWDLRSRFEPVTHVSTHGALLREHMMVPLIVDRPLLRRPERTADVMPSALVALGLPVPVGLDGRSFL